MKYILITRTALALPGRFFISTLANYPISTLKSPRCFGGFFSNKVIDKQSTGWLNGMKYLMIQPEAKLCSYYILNNTTLWVIFAVAFCFIPSLAAKELVNGLYPVIYM